MIEEILMGLGALLWIVGELIAAKKGEDTTTDYVRRGKRLKGFAGRAVLVAVVGGTAWLFVHFVFDKLG
jgi:hypothetical protein